MVTLQTRLLSQAFAVGDPTAGDTGRWVDGLTADQAWRVLGALAKLGITDDGHRDAAPGFLVRECLSRMEREVSDWLRRPFDVLCYLMVVNAVRGGDAAAGRRFWSPGHITVWTAVYGSSPPLGEPLGIRVFRFVEDSPVALASGHLEPVARGLLVRAATNPEKARRIIATIEAASTTLGRPVGLLLGNVVGDYHDLRKVMTSAEKRADPWKKRASELLNDLEATLPPSLRQERAQWFDQLRRAVDDFKMPPPPPEPQVRYGDDRSPEFENAHFLNNWD